MTDVAPGLSAYDRAVSQAEHLADVVALPARRSPSRALLAALRPRQWVKNLLLFAGILFAAKLGEPWRFGEAVAAFAAYCAASSAAYLVNDVRDADDDRRHRNAFHQTASPASVSVRCNPPRARTGQGGRCSDRDVSER